MSGFSEHKEASTKIFFPVHIICIASDVPIRMIIIRADVVAGIKGVGGVMSNGYNTVDH